ncbi:tektin-1 [Poeciliopsis prolifica]|uniref:tektin-1 n=1 Tax=Poeciliopsis prolifica TaxID=188132 RepID=UPI002412F80F|nr:tektin-1 [Poeciliopsis prolifica]
MSVLDVTIPKFDGPDLLNVEVVLNRSELFRAECKRLMSESESACIRMQDGDSKRLDQRVRDIQFLRKEVEMKLEELIPEIDALEALQSRVVKALAMYQDAMKVTLLCLEARRKRAPSDRVHDAVDAELLKECSMLQEVSGLLQIVLEQIAEQIRLDRSAKFYLERDLKEKFQAQNIDNSCALMTMQTIPNNPMPKKNITMLSSATVTPKQWENISDLNIARAEQQKNNSLSLRALVESLLAQAADDMQKQFRNTNEAFQLNIQLLKAAKTQLEDKLPKVLCEIGNLQKIREDLLAAIAEHEQFLSLAQARLLLRKERPGKEQCLDAPQVQLLAEVEQLNLHIAKLREELALSEEEQRALVRCQMELQDNINIKTNSLYIDEVVCMQLREPVVICHV